MPKCEKEFVRNYEIEVCGKESCGKLEGKELCPEHFGERHKEIHTIFLRQLDLMITDFMMQEGIYEGKNLPSNTTLRRFIDWCSEQGENAGEHHHNKRR